jgi:hypothetical protein
MIHSWRMHFAVILLTVAGFLACTNQSYAWSADDTLDAITVASRDTGTPAWELRYIIGCETGGTFNPDMVGDHGHSWGPAQINDYGNARPIFYAYYRSLGMVPDPTNPYQAVYFMAETLQGWHPPLGRWTWNC